MNETPPDTSRGPAALAVAALVVGIFAFLASFVVVGALLGVIGLILGVAHLLRRRRPNGLAWAGVVLSLLSILIGTAMGIAGYRAFTAFREMAGGDFDAFGPWRGVTAPDFTATALDGKTVRLENLRGRRVILDFWATWCGPCVAEVPHFIQLAREVPPSDLAVIGISDEDTGTLKDFVEKQDINYTIATADDLPAPYKNVRAIPTTFIIDRKGVIQEVLVGYQDLAALRKWATAEDYAGDVTSEPHR
jgi:peroxiredoxin